MRFDRLKEVRGNTVVTEDRRMHDSPPRNRDELGGHLHEMQDRLLRFSLTVARVQSPADGEDLVSEAFCKAFEAFESGWRPNHSWEAWLKSVILHLNVTHHRKDAAARRAFGRLVVLLNLEVVPHYSPAEETRQFHEDMRQTLHDCLDQLSPYEREAFELSTLGDVKQYEIADLLGVSQPTVSRLIKSARDQLKQMTTARELWYD
jgi:RNA polymerase sigma factor (sigma-70 family)